MSEVNEIKSITIDDVSIVIPWSDYSRSLLFSQAAPRPDKKYTNEDDITGIEKLVHRFTRVLEKIYPVLRDLPNGSVIMDIGSGNSLIDIIVNAKFPEKKFKFFLVDGDDTFKSNNQTSIYDPFHSKEYNTYNDWEFLRKTISLNNMDDSSYVTLSPDDEWPTETVDLVMSTMSWGWHYPVETYLDKVKTTLKSTGYLYINPVLHINKSLEKINKLFTPLNVIFQLFTPTRSAVENKRTLRLIFENRMDVKRFSFVYLGKKL